MVSLMQWPSLTSLATSLRATIALCLLALTGCPGLNVCECFLCESAVVLTVVEDNTENAVDDFFVEVVRDGQAEGEPVTCQANFRDDNSCAFGEGPGVYVIIISAPGYETLEVSTRVAAEAESEICCRACLSSKAVRAKLTPSPSE